MIFTNYDPASVFKKMRNLQVIIPSNQSDQIQKQ